jgi:hypothetical protein
MLSSGSLAGKRMDGVHQLCAVALTCEDMCHGLVEATVAMRRRRNKLILAPDHSCPRANDAMIVSHSG